MRIILIGLNARYTHSCLALFYVRNELMQHVVGGEIAFEQYTVNDPYHELILWITKTRQDYYFFSAYIWNSDLVEKIISDLLVVDPSCHCVVGGPQAVVVGQALQAERVTIIQGEIEGIGQQFYDDLLKARLRQEYGLVNRVRGFSSPYRDQDFDDLLKNRHVYYETSRGCPFRCTYCLSAKGKYVYHKSIDAVKEELDQILRNEPKVVRFVDRTFNDNGNRALELWKFLADHKCSTSFHFEIGPENFTEEMFTFLEGVPTRKFQFEIGIQSTHEQTLAAIARKINIAEAHSVVRRLSAMNNIHLHVDLILGLPFETKETYLHSFQEVFSMNPHYIQMGLLKILPDTPISGEVEKHGYRFSGNVPYSIYANKWIDYESMQRLYWFGECIERFLNTRYFVSLWDYLRSRSIDIVSFFQELHVVCDDHGFFTRSPTHELLCSMILECVKNWDDRDFIVELLRYDWLRCGHRFLCKPLVVDERESSKELKKNLFRKFSECEFSVESEEERLYVLKKGFVVQFSKEFFKYMCFKGVEGQRVLSFLPDRADDLHRYCHVIPIMIP